MRALRLPDICSVPVVVRALVAAAAVTALFAAAPAAHSEEILVGQYMSGFNGFPYAVAFAKGFFKEAGVDVTAIRSTSGGGANVRELVAGNLFYSEGTVTEAVPAIQQGADIKIISQNTNNLAGMVWVVMPDSPIKSAKDLKGKKLGFTSPGSVSQALELYMLKKLNLGANDVTMVATGGFGPGLTLLEHGGIDVMVLAEPLFTDSKGKYRAVISAEDNLIPAFANGVGLTTGKAAKERPQAIRAVLAARAKAIEFMVAHRAEAAQLISSQTGAQRESVEAVLNELIDHGTVEGVPVYSPGTFNIRSISNIVDIARLSGSIKGDVTVESMIDDSFLPEGLKGRR
jgi:NitT/TauT family transport system substrate-binding protein